MAQYVLNSFLFWFLVAVCSLIVLYIGIDILEKLRWLDRAELGMHSFALLVFLRLPLAVSHILPLASLLAGVLGLASLGQRGELTAIFAAGISPHRVLLPIFTGAILVALSLWGLHRMVLPQAHATYDEVARQCGLTSAAASKPNAWFFSDGRYYHVKGRADRATLRGIASLEVDGENRVETYRIARDAWWNGDCWWVDQADEWKIVKDGGLKYKAVGAHCFGLNLSPALVFSPAPDMEWLDFVALGRALEVARLSGKRTGYLEVGLGFAWILPLSCFLLVWVGGPFVLTVGSRMGLTLMTGWALVVFVVYFALSGVGAFAVLRGWLPVRVGFWAPQVLWFVVGGALQYRLGRT